MKHSLKRTEEVLPVGEELREPEVAEKHATFSVDQEVSHRNISVNRLSKSTIEATLMIAVNY